MSRILRRLTEMGSRLLRISHGTTYHLAVDLGHGPEEVTYSLNLDTGEAMVSSATAAVGPWAYRFTPGLLRALLRSQEALQIAELLLGDGFEVLDREGSLRSLREAVIRYRRAGALDQAEAREVWETAPKVVAAYARDGRWSLVLLPPAFVDLFTEGLLTWTRSPDAVLLVDQVLPALFEALDGGTTVAG